MAVVLTLFFVTPSVAGDFFAAIKERAEQGDVAAQETLCGMFYFGKNVMQNYEQAYIWASLAAAQSPAPEYAAEVRDEVAKKLPPKDLIAAQQRAAELQEKIAANAKNP